MLLGFDMQALKKIKHDMTFEEIKLAGTSRRPGGLKSGTPSMHQNKQCEAINCTLKLSTYTETISIDSDSEPEIEEGVVENVDDDIPSEDVQEVTKEIQSTTDGTSRGETNNLNDGKASTLVALC